MFEEVTRTIKVKMMKKIRGDLYREQNKKVACEKETLARFYKGEAIPPILLGEGQICPIP